MTNMFKSRFKAWLDVAGDRARLTHGQVLCKPEMEPVYQALLRRDLGALGLDDEYYPVGGAANHGLLYLILRCFSHLQLGNVLELGSGQSSLLIDRLSRRFPASRQIFSLEHDAFWGATVQRQVAHPVLCGDLRRETVLGHAAHSYDWRLLPAEVSFELLIIDGPPAADDTSRYARLGALGVLPRLAATDFVVIIDDAERAGERLLAREITSFLSAQRRVFRVSETLAAKRQLVIAGGAHLAAAYF